MGFNLDDYETVEERLAKFWKEYPDGRIETELIEATANRFIVYSKIYRTEADPKPWATGLAFETVSDRGVNSTSALENAESSSIGRALANAGYAKRGARPSREEMEKVQRLKEERIIKVEKPSDPWTIEPKEMPVPVAEAVTQLNDGIKPMEVPNCPKHNKPMQSKSGNKNGRPWFHYKCIGEWPDTCDQIIWYEINKSGQWTPQRPRTEQGSLN